MNMSKVYDDYNDNDRQRVRSSIDQKSLREPLPQLGLKHVNVVLRGLLQDSFYLDFFLSFQIIGNLHLMWFHHYS